MMLDPVGSVPGAVRKATLCEIEPAAQVQVTVPPTAMVTLVGANAMFGPTVIPAVIGGTVAVLVNVTGEPVRVARAVSVWVPELSPSVRTVAAMPSAPLAGAVSETEPPPVPATQCTVKPPTGFP